MADTLRVDVGESTEELVDVELDFENRHRCLHLVEESRGAVDRFRDELLDKVQVNLIPLLAVGVVKRLQLDNVGVANDAHDLQLTVLEALILQDPLDRSIFSGRRQLGLEHHTKRTVADDFALRVGKISGFSSDAVLDSLTNDFCNIPSAGTHKGEQ